jgi:hypothetical protein
MTPAAIVTQILGGLADRPGKTYRVDSVNGGSGKNDGSSWNDALATIDEAVDLAVAGDTILLKGTFTESITVAVAGVTFRGAGTCPREAKWSPATGNDKVNLTINAAYCRVENIYFSPGAQSATYSACIVLGTSASHARIVGNRFQGSTGAYYGIYSPATGADNVHITDNQFVYFNTATYGTAIKTAQASPWNAYSAWQIERNEINSCVNGIVMQARVCRIIGNTIQEKGVAAAGTIGTVLALGISLSGNGAECNGNIVFANQLGGTYGATLYKVANSGDQWAGNYNVLTGGVTADNPA